jgi:hypothetical protein
MLSQAGAAYRPSARLSPECHTAFRARPWPRSTHVDLTHHRGPWRRLPMAGSRVADDANHIRLGLATHGVATTPGPPKGFMWGHLLR